MSLLRVEHVSKSFAGLRALDDVSFAVGEAEIVGLIGPNGAGKTTLFNVVAGSFPPDPGGRVVFGDTDITGWPPHRSARVGLGRTFQLMKPFAGMSVVDNVAVAALAAGGASNLAEAERTAREIVERVGLGAQADRAAGQVPTAGRKRLELARALAVRPRVLLLDEVLAGLTPTERAPVLDLLRAIREDGVALLVVEHVMAAVMALSDRVLVLHHGELLADGTPREVTRDEAVIEAYLGEEMQLADS